MFRKVDNPYKKIERLFEGITQDKNVHSALLAVRAGDGSFEWSGASGFPGADKTGFKAARAPYFFASITKIYTAAMALRLHEQGRLKLDDPVWRYVPENITLNIHRYGDRDYSHDIQIYHLLSHTSGLADYFTGKTRREKSLYDLLLGDGDQEWTVASAAALARNLQPAFPPVFKTRRNTARAFYSDTNYQLLGAVIESVTDKTLHECLQEMIIEPLGLRDTYLHGYSTPRDRSRSAPPPIYFKDRALELDKAMRSFWADGGLVSSADDGLRFLQSLTRGEFFEKAETLSMMREWNRIFFPMQYGMGLMRLRLPRLFSPFREPPEFIGHSGASGSFLFWNEKRDIFLAGTLNQIDKPQKPIQLLMRAERAVPRPKKVKAPRKDD